VKTRRSASFHVIVVGEDLAGLAYAALAARAGYRVGVLGHGTPRGTYTHQGHSLPMEPERVIGFETSPAVNAVFRDLSMGMEMRNLPRPVDPILQYVTPESRLEVSRDFDLWMSELEREFKDGGRTLRHFESWAARACRDTDGLVAGELVLPTVGLRARARYDRAIADHADLIEGRAPDGAVPLDPGQDDGAAMGLVLGALAHLTTLRSQPRSALGTARLWTHLKAGLTTVPGGVDALRGLFLEKLKEQCGSYMASAHVQSVEIRRGRATEVVLSERGERLGCELLVCGMEPSSFFALLGGDIRRDRYHRAVANREPSAWRLTVNIVVDPRVIPVGMAGEVLLVSSPKGTLDGEDCLWISRPGAGLDPNVVQTDTRPGPGVLSVTALMPARGLAPRAETTRALVDGVVDRVRALIPWLDDHLEVVHCPALLQNPETGEETLDTSALVPVYDRALDHTLGVGEYDGRTGLKNVLLCGRGRFGGLGFEGDCMAAMQTLSLTRERVAIKGGVR
jgi:phytoene dehydrogenase-like protein